MYLRTADGVVPVEGFKDGEVRVYWKNILVGIMKEKIRRGIADAVLFLFLVVAEAVVEGLHLVTSPVQATGGDPHGIRFRQLHALRTRTTMIWRRSPIETYHQDSAHSVIFCGSAPPIYSYSCNYQARRCVQPA